MRILRIILSAFLFFAVIAIGGFFLVRELLLYWGESKLRGSLRELSQSQNRGSFGSQCSALGANAIAGESLVEYQLRFISSSEYLVEAVCEGFAYDPITISQGSLPQFVTKVPGTSGFIVSNFEQSGIELEAFALEISKLSLATGFDFSFLAKQKAIVAENGVVVKNESLSNVGNGPVTSCEGYGYQCCNEVSHFGVGDRITGLPDCEQSCYLNCTTRPVLLSLNTNPLMEPQNRTVYIQANTPVEFTFVADFGEADSGTGVLDFGDGKKAPISGLAGQISHTYECASGSCQYVASVTLEDNWGVKSAQIETSKIKIVVTR
ncbi:MAG: hypothetical protein BroJett025_01530 [Patescibacteria group bacterium]|nr:MAG: hypothetical protein BroJett025_01530 [Patescibacteria group bacterium]